jgi:hypothetical protein
MNLQTKEDVEKFVERCETASLQEKAEMYLYEIKAEDIKELTNYDVLALRYFKSFKVLRDLKCVACYDFLSNHFPNKAVPPACEEFSADNLTYIEKQANKTLTKERN